MVRTRSFGVKAGGKSSKKTAAASPLPASSAGTSSSKKSENGNTVQVQPTPGWQREITDFLGNPSKKPRLEDESEDKNSAPVVEADKPLDGDKAVDSECDSVNGNNSTKEAESSDASNKVSADSGSEVLLDGPLQMKKAAKEEDQSEPTKMGAVESTNGCNKKEDDSKTNNENLALEKDGVKVVDTNEPVLPALAIPEQKTE